MVFLQIKKGKASPMRGALSVDCERGSREKWSEQKTVHWNRAPVPSSQER
jgi:hypothetical protein